MLVSVKDVFVPFVEPDGVSSSTKRGPPPPLLPARARRSVHSYAIFGISDGGIERS